MSGLYLGVDGGQSSTTALIADDTGRVLGAGRGGPCNHVEGAEARSKFIRGLEACLGQACRQAGLDRETIAFASSCFGFSGGAEDKDAYTREVIRSGRYKITHDAEIALAGATGAEPGIIVIAGTGSIAFGKNQNGRTARAGGWGYIYGDEGGGFDLVRRALRASLQFEEGWGPSTSLLPTLLTATKAQTANAILHLFYATYSRQQVASLAASVTGAADDGDPVAQNIVSEAACSLAWYIEGVYHNLFVSEPVPVAYVGGVFRGNVLRAALAERLKMNLQQCGLRAPRFSPAAGALLEALRANGNSSELVDVPDSEK